MSIINNFYILSANTSSSLQYSPTLDLSDKGSIVSGMEFPLSESLNLMFNSITDEGIDELTNELVNNTRLRGHNF